MSDITKLPKWAQWRMAQLERQVEELKRELSSRDDSKPTGMKVNSLGGYSGAPQRYADPEMGVTFVYDQRSYVEVRQRDGGLQLMGTGQLIVRPHVTNVIHVELEQR